MAYRKERILNDDEVEQGVEDAGGVAAYARLMGCTPALVSSRLTRIRLARGDYETRDVDLIDDKLRYKPTRAQVRALLASHGADACKERWGRPPCYLLKQAKA